MHPQLDQALCERYSKIFVERHAPDILSCMGRGFETGDGWYALVWLLCEALQQGTDQGGMPQAVAIQVKEKLGSLRFRVRDASVDQRAMIDCAERLSRHICEVCGRLGRSDAGYGAGSAARCSRHRAEVVKGSVRYFSK